MRQMTRKRMPGTKTSADRAMFWGTRGWIAAGTPAAYAVIGVTRSSLAEKEKRDPADSTAAEATLPLKKFDIAPGPVDGAVEAYEKAGADDEGCAAGRDAGAIQLAGRVGLIAKTRRSNCFCNAQG
jgi:hypothetical protein